MSKSADYIRTLESIKTFRDSQTLNNLFDIWCRARYNYHEFDIGAFRKYNWIINNTLENKMTEEQIKQNAEEYAEQNKVNFSEDKNFATYDYYEQKEAYLAGAHSRDEEIEELQKDVHNLEQALSFAEDVADIQRKELDKLRNPWRDAKKELPPKFIDDIGEEYEQSIPVAVRTKNSNHWHMAEYYYDTKEWLCEENNTYIIRDEVTHWMPIPELPKGGEE